MWHLNTEFKILLLFYKCVGLIKPVFGYFSPKFDKLVHNTAQITILVQKAGIKLDNQAIYRADRQVLILTLYLSQVPKSLSKTKLTIISRIFILSLNNL